MQALRSQLPCPPVLLPSAQVQRTHTAVPRGQFFSLSLLSWLGVGGGEGGGKDLEVWKDVGGCGRVKVGGGSRDVEGEPGEGWLEGGVQGC